MNNQKTFLTCLALVLLFFSVEILPGKIACAQENAKPLQVFTLTDGTIIKGKLTGIEDNYYIINTKAMGEVEVSVEEISHITKANAAIAPKSSPGITHATTSSPSGQIQNMQKQLLNDPELFQNIQAIAADPQVVELLKDPELMKAMFQMDPEKIQSNSSAQQLLNLPQMQILMNQVMKKMAIPQTQP